MTIHPNDEISSFQLALAVTRGEAIWMIPTPRGYMRCNSLRPGDFLCSLSGAVVMVAINSSKLGRTVIRWRDGVETSEPHESLVRGGWAFIGHGKRRRLWKYLPQWAQQLVGEFSRP